jgi:tetratricopeptide (TPR) repeat protein
MYSRLSLFGKGLMESTWLAAAAIIPLFFSISSVQTFEPDKMYVLRFLAVLAAAAWLLTRFDAGRQKNGVQLKSFLQLPLVKPVLALTAVYLLSSFFSIVPVVSWWGLYRRAQGTVAHLCYVLLFLILLLELHRSIQLKRLQFALVLTSFPVAGYAILQHYGIDSLPWDEMIGRSAGSMGNPIFLGGYLVMVIPPTLCRVLEGFNAVPARGERKPGFVLICCCGVALVLQLAALFFTQSRGPMAALASAGYVCVFIFAVLHRIRRKDRLKSPLAAAGLGLLIPVLIVGVARFSAQLSARFLLISLSAAVVFSAIVYILIWRTPWGRAWFWLVWLAQSVALLFTFGVYSAGGANSIQIPSLGRLTQFSDHAVGVRKSLWETSIQYLRAGAPAVLPEGTRDPNYRLRRVLGYGPENSWLPAYIYAVPSLGELHAGQGLDRIHNETFDNLLTIGFAGSIAYLALVATALFYSLRCLGFDCSGQRRTFFLLFSVLGILMGGLIPLVSGASYLAGLGIVLGLLAGMVVFAAWSGLRHERVGPENDSKRLFIFGILGALIAHIIETGVGIAVTPTRAYFYIFLGLLAVNAARDLTPQDEPAKNRQPKTASQIQNPMLAYAVISGFVVLVESWCFTFNTVLEPDALRIFLRTWTAPSTLLLVFLTLCGGIALMYSEKTNAGPYRSGFGKMLRTTVLALVFTWILLGMLSAVFWTVTDGSSPVQISSNAEARMTFFLFGLLLLLATAAFVVHAPQQKISSVRVSQALLGFFLAICAIIGTWTLSLRPAWADITSRIASAYQNAGNPLAAVQLFGRASDWAPWEASYRLSLGLAQSTAAISDAGQLERASQSFKIALDLNPLDPVTLRRLGAFHMQNGERASEPALRAVQIKIAISYLRKVALLEPNLPDVYLEMGRCFFLLGDVQQANRLYQKSVQISPFYARSFMYLGEMQYRQKNLEQALQSFTRAARLDRGNIEARKNVGFLLALLGRRDEAIRANLETLQIAPRDTDLLKRLALLYFSIGDYSSGLTYGRRAYDAAPNSGNVTLDQFIEELKNQANH